MRRSIRSLGISLLFLGLFVVAAVADDARSGNQVIDTTVCELTKQPHQFKNKVVRLRSLVESDMIEHTMLVDESCESYGVSLWIPHDLDDNADFKALRNALKEQWKPGAAKTRVFGVFTGTFSLEGKKRFLRAAKVEKVEVSGR